MNKIAAIAIRHWKPVILWNILVLGITITASRAMRSPQMWIATTKLTTPGSNSNLNANLGILGSLNNDSSSISRKNSLLEIQGKILTSETLMEKVLNIDPEKDDFEKVSTFQSMFDVSIDEDSPIININVTSSTSELAKIRANNLKINRTSSTKSFIKMEIQCSRIKRCSTEIDISTTGFN